MSLLVDPVDEQKVVEEIVRHSIGGKWQRDVVLVLIKNKQVTFESGNNLVIIHFSPAGNSHVRIKLVDMIELVEKAIREGRACKIISSYVPGSPPIGDKRAADTTRTDKIFLEIDKDGNPKLSIVEPR